MEVSSLAHTRRRRQGKKQKTRNRKIIFSTVFFVLNNKKHQIFHTSDDGIIFEVRQNKSYNLFRSIFEVRQNKSYNLFRSQMLSKACFVKVIRIGC